MPPVATRVIETVRWCCLVPGQRAVVSSALQELVEQLDQRYSQLPKVALRELTPSEQEEVPRVIAQALTDPASFDRWPHRPLFVSCDRETEYAAAMRSENDQAEWGGARQGEFAVAWESDNKYLLWHEALHLLFAGDCYESEDSSPCDEPFCLMQHEPTGDHCGHGLHLCLKNLTRIAANFR